MLKRIISAVILVTLLVHLAGIYLFTIVRLGEIRMAQRLLLASLPEDQLDVLRIPASKFQASWMEEREIKWAGKMYDIARVVPSGAEVIVYGLHDTDEDNLLTFLSAVVNMAHQDTQPAPTSVVNFFTLEFITTSVLLPQPSHLEGAAAKVGYLFLVPCVERDPAIPPPRA